MEQRMRAFEDLARFLCHEGTPQQLREIGNREFEQLQPLTQHETPTELLAYLRHHTEQQLIFDF